MQERSPGNGRSPAGVPRYPCFTQADGRAKPLCTDIMRQHHIGNFLWGEAEWGAPEKILESHRFEGRARACWGVPVRGKGRGVA
jgi:hypothetical protein